MEKYVVIDSDSSYWDESQAAFDYERGFVVEAGSPAEACAKAQEAGFSGLLFAGVAEDQQRANGPC